MEFEWDENKRNKNIEKHDIDFLDVLDLFENEPLVKKSPFTQEDRWLAIGESQGRRVTVVYTIRGSRIRIISVRKARKNE